MKWAVEIQKTELERRNLTDLMTGLGFTIIETGPGLALTSDEMNSCITSAEAFALAKKVRTAMTGSARIDSTFQLGAVLDYSSDPAKRHVFIEVEPAETKVTASSPTITVGPPKGLTGEALQAWQTQHAEEEYQRALELQRLKLEPAFRNQKAAKVLDLLDRDEPTGEVIYKIYELAEGHPSNRKSFHTQFGIIPEEFKQFQDAVHNPAVSGDWARHAYEDVPKSRKPMSRKEAESFVRRIALQWLKSLRSSL
jgi:hypothetical protein